MIEINAILQDRDVLRDDTVPLAEDVPYLARDRKHVVGPAGSVSIQQRHGATPLQVR